MSDPSSRPPIGKYYVLLLQQMWDYSILSDEDYKNLWFLIAKCASDVEDIQQEFKEGPRYRAQIGYYWRHVRFLREAAESELEKQFYNFYSSVRQQKYGEESRVEDDLPMPVLKNIQRTKRSESPRGQFSRDLVKSHALLDHSYNQQAIRVQWLKYFEDQLDELRTAFSQRHDSLCQWSNNHRQKQRNTGDS